MIDFIRRHVAYLALILAVGWFSCRKPTAHPLAALIIRAEDAPAHCGLQNDLRPMLMLPSDATWHRDLKMTVRWWLGKDLADDEFDAALSNMLHHKAAKPDALPALTTAAVRFVHADIAQEISNRLQYRFNQSDEIHAAVEGSILVIQTTPPPVPKECADALWALQKSRLSEIAR